MKFDDAELDYKIKLAKYDILRITGGLLSGAMIAACVIALYIGFSVLAKVFW